MVQGMRSDGHKMHEIVRSPGFAPDPTGELTAFPRPLGGAWGRVTISSPRTQPSSPGSSGLALITSGDNARHFKILDPRLIVRYTQRKFLKKNQQT